MRKVVVFILALSPVWVSAESLIDTIKGTYNMAVCLKKNTQSMCIFEQILKDSPKKKLKKDMLLKGRSGKYVLKSPNSNWQQLWPKDKQRKEDLVVMDKSGHAYVQTEWSHQQGDYKETAKKPMQELMKKLKAQPTAVPLDIWPYKENGVFYELCYRTNKNTEECMYSAAANIPGGMISIFSITESKEKLVEDIVFIIASVDIPQEK